MASDAHQPLGADAAPVEPWPREDPARSLGTMSGLLRWMVLLTVVGVAGTLAAAVLSVWGMRTGWWAAGAYTAALTAALGVLVVRVAALRAVRTSSTLTMLRGQHALWLPWVLLAAGAAVLAGSQLVMVWSQSTPNSALALAALQDHPEVAVAGLVAYPLLYCGQMLLLGQRVQGVLRSAWLDGLGAALLLAAFAAAFAVPELQQRLELSVVAALALALRPLMDLLLVLFALSCWALAGWRSDSRLALTAAAFISLMLADVTGVLRVGGVLTASGGDADTVLAVVVNLLRLMALLALAAAAAAPTRAPLQARVVRWSAVAGPASVLLQSLGLLLLDQVWDIGVLAALLAVTALASVGAKLVLLFHEVLQLADSRRLALSDDLTGLANRRALRQALGTALQAAQTSASTAAAATASTSRSRVGGQLRGSARRRAAHAAPEQALVALLLLDLNGFKAVNDRYGHDAGDALLRATASHLRACLPPGAVLVRLGGDEFAVLLTGGDAAAARIVAGTAAAAVARASVVHHDGAGWALGAQRTSRQPKGIHLATSASVGVAIYDASSHRPHQKPIGSENPAPAVGAAGHVPAQLTEPGAFANNAPGAAPASAGSLAAMPYGVDPASELLRRADVAMYRAKGSGGGVRLFDLADDDAAQHKAQLLDDLRAALAPQPDENPAWGSAAVNRQIVVHYQPQVDVQSGHPTGVEALVRWRHPRLGLLYPDTFVGLAEDHGLVAALTTEVLHTAVRDAMGWQANGHQLRVAVNLSTSCLSNPALLPMVDEVLEHSGVSPELLVLEITETMLMSDPHQALSTARGIRARGVQLSIDDYGTGYSSLAYLSDLPATELKLDRSFTARITSDPGTAAIVASTVDLAHRLGLRLLAEGVEDAATLAMLASMGCDETQGYLHARPMPAHQLNQWLRDAAYKSSDATDLDGVEGAGGAAQHAEHPGTAGTTGTLGTPGTLGTTRACKNLR